MSAVIQHESADSPPNGSWGWVGTFQMGKWYCRCGLPADVLTTTKESSNKGRIFWSCPIREKNKCKFFIWQGDEHAAREWVQLHPTPPAPQTPTRSVNSGDRNPAVALSPEAKDSEPQKLETPFTKATRRGRPPKSKVMNSDEDGNGEQSHDAGGPIRLPIYVLDDPFKDSQQPPEGTPEPSRKAAKRSQSGTPSQAVAKRPRGRAAQLQTPETRDKHAAQDFISRRRSLSASPTPAGLSARVPYKPTVSADLAATVVDLVRAEYPGLKASTEIQIRHEIGMVLNVEATKLQQSKETIAELRKRADELEELILKRVDELDAMVSRSAGGYGAHK